MRTFLHFARNAGLVCLALFIVYSTIVAPRTDFVVDVALSLVLKSIVENLIVVQSTVLKSRRLLEVVSLWQRECLVTCHAHDLAALCHEVHVSFALAACGPSFCMLLVLLHRSEVFLEVVVHLGDIGFKVLEFFLENGYHSVYNAVKFLFTFSNLTTRLFYFGPKLRLHELLVDIQVSLDQCNTKRSRYERSLAWNNCNVVSVTDILYMRGHGDVCSDTMLFHQSNELGLLQVVRRRGPSFLYLHISKDRSSTLLKLVKHLVFISDPVGNFHEAGTFDDDSSQAELKLALAVTQGDLGVFHHCI